MPWWLVSHVQHAHPVVVTPNRCNCLPGISTHPDGPVPCKKPYPGPVPRKKPYPGPVPREKPYPGPPVLSGGSIQHTGCLVEGLASASI